MATLLLLFGPFECTEHEDGGEGHALTRFGYPFFPLTTREGPRPSSGSLLDPNLGNLAQFVELGLGLAVGHCCVLALERAQSLVAPVS